AAARSPFLRLHLSAPTNAPEHASTPVPPALPRPLLALASPPASPPPIASLASDDGIPSPPRLFSSSLLGLAGCWAGCCCRGWGGVGWGGVGWHGRAAPKGRCEGNATTVHF